MNTVNFLASLRPEENQLYEILKIEGAKDYLHIVLGCSDGTSASMCVHFREVSGFEHTLFGAPGDSDQLPQTLIGLDHWNGINDGETHHWELNGGECTWNFRAPLPKVDNC